MLQRSRGRYRPYAPDTTFKRWVLSGLQYAIALGAAANIAVLSWQLGVGTVCSWWSETVFGPLVWSILSIPIHLGGTFAIRLRVRRIETDEEKHMDIRFPQWLRQLPKRLSGYCKSEWVPAVAQDKIRTVSFEEGKVYIAWSWFLSTATVIHILFGSLVLSGLLFIGPRDALLVIFRYVVSVLVCRILITFELAGLEGNSFEKQGSEAVNNGLSSLASAYAFPPRQRLSPRRLQPAATSPLVSRSRPAYYFDQTIDHFPHSSRYIPHAKGTFKQRYFVETSYYKPGGPVFLFLGGEGTITGDTHLDNSLIEQLSKRFNGIGIVIENRYYGASVPFNTTTTDELLYLTTEQVIADFDLFARKVKLPGINGSANAPSTPWIVYGGSYSGALSAFTIKTYPETYYGAISSSGVIHGQVEYPQWYDPIQKFGPQDCVASVNDIIDKMDAVVLSNNQAAIRELKEIFGLSALEDIRDFAQTIAFPLGGPFFYPSYSFQELNWNPAYGHQDFFDFCSNVTDINAAPDIMAVDNAVAKYTGGKAWKNLGNYAAYIKRVFLPLCTSGDYNSPQCFGTQHPDWWADTTNGDERSWLYTTCTEFGAYQAAQPYGTKSLLSRVVNSTYTQEWCTWAFPKGKKNTTPSPSCVMQAFYSTRTIGKHNSIPPAPDNSRWNSYGDFALKADRLLFLDGGADVWRDLCWHSDLAPPRPSYDMQEQHLINGAGHVWDLRTLEDIDAEPQFIRATTKLEIRVVEMWLREFNSSTYAL
ncbi:hypothetical protein O1611_g9625 [Lasiodiplodia mahajangana]|uniref:Uncharacterized protein n=1 Tax=Lasiodiplodia mahajangana TaxID=1108764 RepID=A0ACC2J7B2_9PEZI|nr:hypothetical protein O1611_g9625 [Lasiodiplodia mahajangana]